MALSYSKKELTEEEIAAYTPERCWATIERVGKLLKEPGLLQAELKIHPEFGPEFDEVSKELLHLMIDEYDVAKSPAEQKVVERLGELFHKLDVLQADHLLSEIAEAGTMMQMLPITDIISSADENIDDITSKMSPEEAEAFAAKREEYKANGTSMASCKLDERIVPIFSAGVMAAGGHSQFATMQMECAKELPEELRDNPSLVVATQMTSAVMKAIIMRATRPDYVNMQIRTIIESTIALKQALHMTTVSAWMASPEELLDYLQNSMKASIMNSLVEFKEGVELDEAVETELRAGTTLFPNPGSVN